MNTETCLEIQASVDGELNASRQAAVDRLCATDPAARSLRASLTGVRETLRTHEPEYHVPDTREFYWSQIQRRIAAAETNRPAEVERPSALLGILRWLVPAAGIAAVAMVFTLPPRSPVAPVTLASAGGATPATTVVYRSDTDGVTVHWIN